MHIQLNVCKQITDVILILLHTNTFDRGQKKIDIK